MRSRACSRGCARHSPACLAALGGLSRPARRTRTSLLAVRDCSELLADPPPSPADDAGAARARARSRADAERRAAETPGLQEGRLPLGARLRPSSRVRPGARPASHRCTARVSTRHQPRARARRTAAVRHRARAVSADAAQARRARLLGRPAAHARAARRRWRSSRAAGSSSKRAISTCWSTSSRTRAAPSGRWSSCWSDRGPRALAWRDALEPTIFIVGDRKQSIYGFRDAEVAVLDEASRYIEALRPIGQVRTAITPQLSRRCAELLHFVNDLFAAIEKSPIGPTPSATAKMTCSRWARWRPTSRGARRRSRRRRTTRKPRPWPTKSRRC